MPAFTYKLQNLILCSLTPTYHCPDLLLESSIPSPSCSLQSPILRSLTHTYHCTVLLLESCISSLSCPLQNPILEFVRNCWYIIHYSIYASFYVQIAESDSALTYTYLSLHYLSLRVMYPLTFLPIAESDSVMHPITFLPIAESDSAICT